MITTTLNAIRKHKPCVDSWKKLLAGLGKRRADSKPLPFHRIVEVCGLEDALWATRAAPEHDREWRLFAVACARDVQYPMADCRSVTAIDVAERFANGNATRAELDAAWSAARAARDAALDAMSGAWWDAIRAEGWASGAAAWDAARKASWGAMAASAAARERAHAAARGAARESVSGSAGVAARDKQRERFLDLVGRGHE
jgi:hypothetical protein